jgi:hypothetical protein
MADVATSGTSVTEVRKEGTVVVGARQNGNVSTNSSNNKANPVPVTTLDTKLSNRLDDPQYYTA